MLSSQPKALDLIRLTNNIVETIEALHDGDTARHVEIEIYRIRAQQCARDSWQHLYATSHAP